MSSDGEMTKNQPSEVCAEVDEKEKLDTTDSSQDAAKSETEDDKETKEEVDTIEKEKSPEPTKTEVTPEEKDNVKQNDTEKKDNNDVDVKNNKDDKSEDKTDEDTEGGEGTGDEGDDKKEVPLLDQPLEQVGTRERKKVQRFNEEFTPESTTKEPTKVEVPEGSGTQLGDIPRIDASISRFKTEDLKLLHRVLFKTPGKNTLVKKNIKKFNGFEFTKDSDAYSKKVSSVQKLEVKQLKSICEMLDLEKNGKKEEICDRICDFLLEPKDSGKPVGGGRPKRTAAVRANNRGYSSHDDDDSDSGSKRASRSRRGKGKRVNLKEESSSESDAEFNPSEESDEETPRVTNKKRNARVVPKKQEESEDEVSDVDATPSSEESDEPKSKRKRGNGGTTSKVQNNKSKKTSPKIAKATPKKSAVTPKKKADTKNPAGKKRGKEESDEEDDKDNSENNDGTSSEDEPLVKKSKSPQPPTDEEIKTYVKEILEGANLEEITMKTVCKQVYAHYPDFDLAHKKDFIKTTVKSLIST